MIVFFAALLRGAAGLTGFKHFALLRIGVTSTSHVNGWDALGDLTSTAKYEGLNSRAS